MVQNPDGPTGGKSAHSTVDHIAVVKKDRAEGKPRVVTIYPNAIGFPHKGKGEGHYLESLLNRGGDERGVLKEKQTGEKENNVGIYNATPQKRLFTSATS